MNAPSFDFAPDRQRSKSRAHRHRSTLAARSQTDDGFFCKHCNVYVTSAPFLSGVQNRNHCPYCLWSRHVDLYEAGDRLSACRSPMEPIGLTVKATRKKYGPGRGELMLIHLCIECDRLSINRIAADDDSQKVFSIFVDSFHLESPMQSRLDVNGIRALESTDSEAVRTQLFGYHPDLAGILFQSEVEELV